MKIIRELLAELKRSNDLKEKEIDFQIMDDYTFGEKYDCYIPMERRQQNPMIVKVDNTVDPYNPSTRTY